MFIPIANLVIVVMMLFVSGTKGVNRFGPPPPPNKTWHWFAARGLPLIATIGVLAAIALPAYQDYVERAQSQVSIQSVDRVADQPLFKS